MKKILYFLLAVLATVYIMSLSAETIFPSLINMGWFGEVLHYLNIYGGVGIAFLIASVNFTGNIFKVILNIILILVSIVYVVITFFPDFFKGVLGF